jgi:Uma2 family endonuclease
MIPGSQRSKKIPPSPQSPLLKGGGVKLQVAKIAPASYNTFEGMKMATAGQIEKKKTYTYADYEKLPEGAPYQLIGGGLVMTPSPVPYHQMISMKLGFELLKFVEKGKLGVVLFAPIDVSLSETDTYQPDIIFISKDRLSIIGEKRIEGPPDLVIEILSPATAYYDLRIKKDTYEQSGVKEYWIVDPIQKTIEIFLNKKNKFELFSSAKGEGEVKSELLAGFSIGISGIFE